MNVGEIEILPVLDGAMHAPPTLAYVGTTEADWEPHKGLLDADGRVEMALGGFLLRSGDRVALIDIGLGPDSPVPFMQGGQLLDSLAAHGVKPGDVTDVVFTHLHFDHIGWASREGAATFANATYRCDERDWHYFVTTDPSDEAGPAAALGAGSGRALLEPVAARLEPWDGDAILLPGLDVRLAAGHTPGSGVMVVSSGDERAVLLGDVAHCPVELLDDEWAGIGDVDPELAKRTRAALMRELEGEDVPVTAAHFPGLRFGRILNGSGRRQWVV